MADLVLQKSTEQAISAYLSNPGHAICLVGPPGAGKSFVSLKLAQEVIETTREDAIYTMGEDSEAGIEAVRKLQHFLQLKMPGSARLKRAIILENIERMSSEAQNALLKTLEEPPEDTIFILTTMSLAELKPTVRSRCQIIIIKPLSLHEAQTAFPVLDIGKAYALSGGYVGLLHALLNNPDHELVTAVTKAKELLQATTFERLRLVDSIAKSKESLPMFFYALQRVISAASTKAKPDALKKLVSTQRTLYEAQQDNKKSANTKLLLTDLALQL